MEQKLLQHQESEPPSLKVRCADVPEELDSLVKRMMAKRPADRFSIPLLVVTPLRRFMAGGISAGRTGGGLNSPSWTKLTRPGLPEPNSICHGRERNRN